MQEELGKYSIEENKLFNGDSEFSIYKEMIDGGREYQIVIVPKTLKDAQETVVMLAGRSVKKTIIHCCSELD